MSDSIVEPVVTETATAGETSTEPVVEASSGESSGEESIVTPAVDEYKPPAWALQMSGEMKQDKFFKDYESITDVGSALKAKSKELDELKTSSESLLKVPGKDSTPEEKTAFLKRLGRPDAVEGYKKLDSKALDGVELSREKLETLSKTAFAAGLSQNQFAILQKAEAISEKSDAEVNRKAGLLATSTLKEAWPGDAYKKNVGLLNRAIDGLEKMGAANLRGVFSDPKLGNNVPLIKAFAVIGEMMHEDQLLDGTTRPTPKEFTGALTYKTMKT